MGPDGRGLHPKPQPVPPRPAARQPRTGPAPVRLPGRRPDRDRLAGHPQGIQHTVALSSYLANAGTDLRTQDGVVYRGSRTNFLHVTDGSSNTILLGERPPSPDLIYGWWYAGTGLGGSGVLDFSLTARHRGGRPGYPQYRRCPPGPYYFAPRRFDDPCGVFHYWSPHPGGANFGFCDGSARFLRYSADAVLPALSTRAGGEAAVAE